MLSLQIFKVYLVDVSVIAPLSISDKVRFIRDGRLMPIMGINLPFKSV